MKTPLAIATVGLILVGSVLAAEVPPFPADVTHGNVRVVLMSVGQTTYFLNEKDSAQTNSPWKDSKQGVHCFTVTFLLESLGDGPLGRFSLKDLAVLSAGKSLGFVGAGSEYQQILDYKVFKDIMDFTKPKVTNPKRAIIMRCVRFGAIPNLQPLSLVIDAGFEKEIQKFQFDGIRFQ